MASEDIELEYRAGRWQVRAVYVFENVGTTVQTVQIGFPETRCEEEDSDCKSAPFADLVTKVDGKTVQHRKGSVSAKHEWASHVSVVWLFDVSFSPSTTTRIEHSYSLASGNDVAGKFLHHVRHPHWRQVGWRHRTRDLSALKLHPRRAHPPAQGIPLKQAALEGARIRRRRGRESGLRTHGLGAHRRLVLLVQRLAARRHDGGPTLLGLERQKESGLSDAEVCNDLNSPRTPSEWRLARNLIYALNGYPSKHTTPSALSTAAQGFREVKSRSARLPGCAAACAKDRANIGGSAAPAPLLPPPGRITT